MTKGKRKYSRKFRVNEQTISVIQGLYDKYLVLARKGVASIKVMLIVNVTFRNNTFRLSSCCVDSLWMTAIQVEQSSSNKLPCFERENEWWDELKCDRAKMSDADRPDRLGRLDQVTSSQMIEQTHDLMIDDGRAKVH